MAYEEKSAWLMGVLAVIAYATYGLVVWGLARESPLVEVDYVPAMLGTIGGSIVASIVAHITLGLFSQRNASRKDQRDRQISRMGEHVGQSFVIAGALAAMLLAMFEFPTFWIANAVYLAFVLSAILGAIARLVSYRKGMPAW